METLCPNRSSKYLLLGSVGLFLVALGGKMF